MRLNLDTLLDQIDASSNHNLHMDREIDALIAIARAAVAWRDAVNVDGASGKVATVRDLLDALREAGL